MCAIAQNLGQPVGQNPWLNQFDSVVVRHDISLLRWRSGGSNTPAICRLPRLTPSPTFGHSSRPRMVDVLDCQMEFVFVVLGIAAIFRAAIFQHAAALLLMDVVEG